jgi:hypothetical protein
MFSSMRCSYTLFGVDPENGCGVGKQGTDDVFGQAQEE